MAASRATTGNTAQFTYDFGIAIAQSTVNKITRLTGATLTLASAFYALKSSAEQYVSTLRENTLRFGGVLSTMQAMEQAQNRLIKGQSYFSVDDQLRGMNELMAAGINVGKNLDWINKAAHATGKSFAEFSGMISQAVQGNMSAMVDAGLMTQRATRVFDKYAANTVMRQRAIMNFLRTHKGLMNAIKNDFETVQDQMIRIKGIWQGFLHSILGKPNDPGSFYGQIVKAMKTVAEALARNFEEIRRRGWVIGQVLGWIVRQIGHFVVWLGSLMKRALNTVWKMQDNYVEQTRSLLVWLEFWKVHIIDLINEYKGQVWDAIKTTVKWFLVYKGLRTAFFISKGAILSVQKFRREWVKLVAFMQIGNIGKLGGLGRLMSFKLMKKSNNREILRFFGFSDPTKIEGAFVRTGQKIERGLIKVFGGGKLKNALKKTFGVILTLINPFKIISNIKKATHIAYDLVVGSFRVLGKVGKVTFGVLSSAALGLVNIMRNLPALMVSFGGVLKAVGVGFIRMVVNLPSLIRSMAVGIKALWAALSASNPVGWIMLAIGLLVTLYMKSKQMRILVNTMFKTWWEYIKLIWNLAVGLVTLIMVGVKKVWNFLMTWIFKPIWNGIKAVIGWIGKMWAKFKDSTVGRWINKILIQPLKALFTGLWNVFKKILKGIGGLLGLVNNKLGNSIKKLADDNGISFMGDLVAKGNEDAGKPDDTNYILEAGKLFSPPGGSGDDKALAQVSTPTNPLTYDTGYSGGSRGGGGDTTTMQFSSGAIQIVVEKGENIDERLLAQKVKEIMRDLQRENAMRGGAA